MDYSIKICPACGEEITEEAVEKHESLSEADETELPKQHEPKCAQTEHAKTEVTLETKKLAEIFKMEELSIPDYQRIYCWDEKQVYQLWKDIIALTDKKYHMGAIILHKKDSKLNIVDGQQRLVTLTLILQALGAESINLPLLQQSFNSEQSCQYIAYNKYLINNYIGKNDQDKESLRGRILEKLTFSVLTLSDTSLDLAYTFFSNQNSKGVPLSDYNLLKAHHLRYVYIEEQAKHLAGRWDNLLIGENDAEADLKRTLGMFLFRMRKWMRKKQWNEDSKYRVRNEFKAALILPEIPPFGEQFNFYEKIQGGSHFFAYAEHFVYLFKTFSKTLQYKSLEKNLSGESHWKYKDVIETLLFGYYLKFGTMYLTDALVCIEQLISKHRYENNRALLYKILEYAGKSEIIMMIDQATSPTFFLAEALDKINRMEKVSINGGIQKRYKVCVIKIYKELNDYSDEQIKKLALNTDK